MREIKCNKLEGVVDINRGRSLIKNALLNSKEIIENVARNKLRKKSTTTRRIKTNKTNTSQFNLLFVGMA